MHIKILENVSKYKNTNTYLMEAQEESSKYANIFDHIEDFLLTSEDLKDEFYKINTIEDLVEFIEDNSNDNMWTYLRTEKDIEEFAKYIIENHYNIPRISFEDEKYSEGLAVKDDILIGIGTCKDTDIIIPWGVTSIGSDALWGCSSLKSITIPESVTSIGDYAFYDCSGLTSITIPESVTSIGKSAFSFCSSLTSIPIPNSVTSIGKCAFYGCKSLTSIAIPERVTSIGNQAFVYCNSLKSLTIPDSITSIGDYAFYGCKSLTSMTIPESVTSIGDHTFDCCSSLTSIAIPDSATSIGYHAFYDCSKDLKIISDSKYVQEYCIKNKLHCQDAIGHKIF